MIVEKKEVEQVLLGKCMQYMIEQLMGYNLGKGSSERPNRLKIKDVLVSWKGTEVQVKVCYWIHEAEVFRTCGIAARGPFHADRLLEPPTVVRQL